jgi:hypothetical protein
MKAFLGLILISLLIAGGGCATYSVVKDAKGQHEQALWLNKIPSDDADQKPQPAYYFLLPVAFPLDVATAPVSLYLLFLGTHLPNS